MQQFEISYEIPNAVYIDGNVGRLLLDFIGQENPYIVEKGQIIVTYPQNAQLFQAYAFYGKNNQTSPNAGSFYQDQEGHLIYKMNTILPAGINLQLDILSDAITFDVPRPEGLTEKISYYPWFIMILIYCLVIFCYLFFAAQDLKDQFLSKKYMNKVRGRFKYDVTLFRPLILKKSDDLSFFVAVLFLFQKKIKSCNH